MKRILLHFTGILCLFMNVGSAHSQTFTFECVCAHVSNDTCDICPVVPGLESRSFHGLLIRRNGTPYRWIDEPYTVKRFANETIEFLEMIPNPDKIIIARFQTPFATIQGFADSTNCVCNFGGGMATVEVDTPIVGDGSAGNPIKIGQFGADTNDVLVWNGRHWYPGKVKFGKIDTGDLPYYINDEAAMAGGLSVGDTYLLDCGNTLGMPSGVYKVVKICGFDCFVALKYFVDDEAAFAAGIPQKSQYCVDESNPYGVQNGFVKLVVRDSVYLTGGLSCSAVRDYYVNDIDALGDGKEIGDLYATSSANTYGSPAGMERAVSQISSTMADSPSCCSLEDNLPFFSNDGTAVTGGLSAGSWYYLSQSNTYGYPYSTKKQIQ